MKKVYLLFMAMIAGTASFAQAIPNSGMETWRNKTSGISTVVNVHAPTLWFGFDSLIIAQGQAFAPLIFPGAPNTEWKAQLFEESTIIHGGTRSAKVITVKQDTLGLVPGSLSNASVTVNITKLIGGADIVDALTFSGGSPATSRIDTVKAWVEYFPGIDPITHLMGGLDSGTITVQSYARIASKDSLIGAGFAYVTASATFKEIAVPVVYTDTVDSVTFVRIIFASSGGAVENLDSSTLYVDDVTMSGKPYTRTTTPPINAVAGIQSANNVVKVYPNPATGTLYLDGPRNAGLNCKLFSVQGQLVMTRTLTGNDAVDISALAAGSYIYTITNAAGSAIQSGKVAVSK